MPALPRLQTDMSTLAGPVDGAESTREEGPEKLLPPVPLSIAKKDAKSSATRAAINDAPTKAEAEITLSPSVYTPGESSPRSSPNSSPKSSPRGSPRGVAKGKGKAIARGAPAHPPPAPPVPEWSPVDGTRVKSVEWI